MPPKDGANQAKTSKEEKVKLNLHLLGDGQWTLDSFLGKGGNAAVFRVSRGSGKARIEKAVKLISVDSRYVDLSFWNQQLRQKIISPAEYQKNAWNVLNDTIPELRFMALLSVSPNVLGYEDYVFFETQDDNQWNVLILMDILKPLGQHLTRSGANTLDILYMWRDIGTVLQLCAQFSILHLDIKDANILVTQDGRYKLIDWGQACYRSDIQRLAREGRSVRIGTESYMAPEVFVERYRMGYDERADQYSLGLVAYYYFNGMHLPFADKPWGQLSATERQNIKLRRVEGKEPLPRPSGLDNDIWFVLQKTCAYSPADRYSTAAEMVHAINVLIEARSHKKNIKPIVIGASAAAALLLGLIVLLPPKLSKPTPDPVPVVTATAMPVSGPTISLQDTFTIYPYPVDGQKLNMNGSDQITLHGEGDPGEIILVLKNGMEIDRQNTGKGTWASILNCSQWPRNEDITLEVRYLSDYSGALAGSITVNLVGEVEHTATPVPTPTPTLTPTPTPTPVPQPTDTPLPKQFARLKIDTKPVNGYVKPEKSGSFWIRGTGEPRQEVRIFLNDVKLGNVGISSSGEWSCMLDASELPQDGECTFTVVYASGDEDGKLSASIVGKVDIIHPQPEVSGEIDDSAKEIRGKADVNSDITISRDGRVLASGSTAADGSFSLTLKSALRAGDVLVIASQDEAGNEAQTEVTVAAEVRDAIKWNLDNAIGMKPGQLLLEGSAKETSDLLITWSINGSVKKDEIQTKPDGKWEFTIDFSSAKHAGSSEIRIVYKDKPDDTSLSKTAQITFDNECYLTLDNEFYVEGMLNVTGTADPLAEVKLCAADRAVLDQKTADQNGRFFLALANAQAGETYTVIAEDPSGNFAEQTFVLERKLSMNEAPEIIKPAALEVSGVAEASRRELELIWTLNGAQKTAAVKVESDGSWRYSIDYSSAKHESESVIAVRYRDQKNDAKAETSLRFDAACLLEVDQAIITEETTQISGAADPEAAVELLLNGSKYDEQKAGQDGSFSFRSLSLNAGNTYTLIATDRFGNQAEYSFVVGRMLSIDPGTSRIIRPQSGFVVSGMAEASRGELDLTWTLNGTQKGTTVQISSDGTWSHTIDYSSAEHAGTSILTICYRDGKDDAEASREIRFDGESELTLESEVVNEKTRQLRGKAEPDAAVVLHVGNASLTITADEQGNFSFENLTLKAGDVISIDATDTLENRQSKELSVGAADRAPIVISECSHENMEWKHIAVTGTAEPGQSLAIAAGKAQAATVSVGQNGRFSMDLDAETIADGELTITVSYADGFGKEYTVEKKILIDTQAPAVTVKEAEANRRIQVTQTQLTGTTEAGARLHVTLDGTVLNPAVQQDGQFAVQLPRLNPGQRLTLSATDAAGNTSGELVLEVYLPDRKIIDIKPPDSRQPDYISASSKQDAGSYVFSGTAEKNMKLALQAEANGKTLNLNAVDTDASGRFEIAVPSSIEDGRLTIRAAYADGFHANLADEISLMVDRSRPQITTVDQAMAGEEKQIEAIYSEITGIASEAGTAVTVRYEGREYSAVTDETGRFAVSGLKLTGGSQLEIETADQAGNRGETLTYSIKEEFLDAQIAIERASFSGNKLVFELTLLLRGSSVECEYAVIKADGTQVASGICERDGFKPLKESKLARLVKEKDLIEGYQGYEYTYRTEELTGLADGNYTLIIYSEATGGKENRAAVCELYKGKASEGEIEKLEFVGDEDYAFGLDAFEGSTFHPEQIVITGWRFREQIALTENIEIEVDGTRYTVADAAKMKVSYLHRDVKYEFPRKIVGIEPSESDAGLLAELNLPSLEDGKHRVTVYLNFRGRSYPFDTFEITTDRSAAVDPNLVNVLQNKWKK